MNNVHEAVREKVVAIFCELAPDRAERVRGDRPAWEAMATLRDGLLLSYSEEKVVSDIAFHLSDWKWEAAFLVAVHLFPERFTSEEIDAGVRLLIIHAPNHLAAAAKLAGHPVEDIFGKE